MNVQYKQDETVKVAREGGFYVPFAKVVRALGPCDAHSNCTNVAIQWPNSNIETFCANMLQKVETDKGSEEPEKETLQAFAERVREFHFSVACNENPEISACGALGGKVYDVSQKMFLAAIAAAYPELEAWRIYDLWADNNDTVAYNAKYVKRQMQEETDIRNFCAVWHPNHKYMEDRKDCIFPLEKCEDE